MTFGDSASSDQQEPARGVEAFNEASMDPVQQRVDGPLPRAAREIGVRVEPEALAAGLSRVAQPWRFFSGSESRGSACDLGIGWPLRAAFSLLLLCPAPASADWIATGTPICTATGDQYNIRLAPADSTGIYLVWGDIRSGVEQIYAQRRQLDGSIADGWPMDGLAVSHSATTLGLSYVAAGDSGRLFVAWSDPRNGQYDVFLQCLTASGEPAPGWPVDAQPVCIVLGRQFVTSVIADDRGGVLIGWTDYRTGIASVYMQRISGDGTPYPGWPPDGLLVCDEPGARYVPLLCADGANGAIVTWTDYRAGNSDIYAQHVLATGELDPSWPAAGVPVCTESTNQFEPSICADGTGGAFVSWTDPRYDYLDIFAQRVRQGAVLWAFNGVQVCGAPGSQWKSRVVLSANPDTAMVVWQDGRTSWDAPYVQRLLPSGAAAPGWPTDGLSVNATFNYALGGISMVPDGTGGAYVTWSADYDNAGTQFDVFCQRVTAAAQWAAGWPVGELPVCAEFEGQTSPGTLLMPDGELLVAWVDTRGLDADIYAAAVTAAGVVPTLFTCVGSRVDEMGVHLQWYGTEYAGQTLYLFKAVSGEVGIAVATLIVASNGVVSHDDTNVVAGSTIHYWLCTTDDVTGDGIGLVTVTVPPRNLALGLVISPNPASGPVTLALAAPSRDPVVVECVDVAGRQVLSRRVEGGACGNRLILTELDQVPSGVYVVMATQGADRVVRRIVVLR